MPFWPKTSKIILNFRVSFYEKVSFFQILSNSWLQGDHHRYHVQIHIVRPILTDGAIVPTIFDIFDRIRLHLLYHDTVQLLPAGGQPGRLSIFGANV